MVQQTCLPLPSKLTKVIISRKEIGVICELNLPSKDLVRATKNNATVNCEADLFSFDNSIISNSLTIEKIFANNNVQVLNSNVSGDLKNVTKELESIEETLEELKIKQATVTEMEQLFAISNPNAGDIQTLEGLEVMRNRNQYLLEQKIELRKQLKDVAKEIQKINETKTEVRKKSTFTLSFSLALQSEKEHEKEHEEEDINIAFLLKMPRPDSLVKIHQRFVFDDKRMTGTYDCTANFQNFFKGVNSEIIEFEFFKSEKLPEFSKTSCSSFSQILEKIASVKNGNLLFKGFKENQKMKKNPIQKLFSCRDVTMVEGENNFFVLKHIENIPLTLIVNPENGMGYAMCFAALEKDYLVWCKMIEIYKNKDLLRSETVNLPCPSQANNENEKTFELFCEFDEKIHVEAKTCYARTTKDSVTRFVSTTHVELVSEHPEEVTLPITIKTGIPKLEVTALNENKSSFELLCPTITKDNTTIDDAVEVDTNEMKYEIVTDKNIKYVKIETAINSKIPVKEEIEYCISWEDDLNLGMSGTDKKKKQLQKPRGYNKGHSKYQPTNQLSYGATMSYQEFDIESPCSNGDDGWVNCNSFS